MSEKKGTSQLPMPAATTATNAATVAFPKPASSVLPPSMSSSLRRRSRTSSWGKAILSSLSTSKFKAPSDKAGRYCAVRFVVLEIRQKTLGVAVSSAHRKLRWPPGQDSPVTSYWLSSTQTLVASLLRQSRRRLSPLAFR